MEAISHRNQNITGPHAVGRAGLIVVGMVRVDGQRLRVKQQGRLLPLCKELFGFVAKVCQASYDSNAKTTLNNPTARHGRDTLHSPHRHSCGGRNPEVWEGEGHSHEDGIRQFATLPRSSPPASGTAPHPDTTPLPRRSTARYPPRMQEALSRHVPETSASARMTNLRMVSLSAPPMPGHRLFPLREKTRLDSTRTGGWAGIGRAHPRRLHEEWRRAVQWKVPLAPAWRPIPLNRRRHDPRDSPAASQRL